ncbi:MAG: hypothetical protein IPL81_05700 [Flavobacteriales bacterium]|nr:hypothetical protein [Flavobacteriales bacterium]MBK7248418.1 hypothetical protein [Flavobacteriales bacterium]MBK9059372.1 hypothetical protein [Flavobacteriales bacterium]QQS73671.1 MAG: hypothetical protein IPP95_05470 [Flavobacteriales bacterium]HQV37416.1 hypothetical protein [Flavobacteriales bacterium]
MSSLNRSACRRLTSTTSPVDSEQLSPLLPQVFPANQTMRSSMLGRGDLWVMFDVFIHAYP